MPLIQRGENRMLLTLVCTLVCTLVLVGCTTQVDLNNHPVGISKTDYLIYENTKLGSYLVEVRRVKYVTGRHRGYHREGLFYMEGIGWTRIPIERIPIE